MSGLAAFEGELNYIVKEVNTNEILILTEILNGIISVW